MQLLTHEVYNPETMRRLIDISFAVLCLTITLPIMLLIAFLIKIESQGPVFYRQRMIGWKGREFPLFRFRTMYMDMGKEQRFTRVGRFIRNYSLDHMPQLINLLIGDLTLIGPRPMEVGVVDLQDFTWQQYVQIKPGLINYAIFKLGKEWTSSRSIRPELNQELELQYLKQRSIASDVRLFLHSLWKFIASRGNIKARGDVDVNWKQEKES